MRMLLRPQLLLLLLLSPTAKTAEEWVLSSLLITMNLAFYSHFLTISLISLVLIFTSLPFHLFLLVSSSFPSFLFHLFLLLSFSFPYLFTSFSCSYFQSLTISLVYLALIFTSYLFTCFSWSYFHFLTFSLIYLALIFTSLPFHLFLLLLFSLS